MMHTIWLGVFVHCARMVLEAVGVERGTRPWGYTLGTGL